MPKIKNKESSNIAQWYVVNAFSGNEDLTIENIKGKVNSYNVSHLVPEIRVVKQKIKKIEEITKENAPKTIRNRKNVSWEVLPNGNYLKTTIKEENKYPGYMFIKMVMNDQSWYIVRNTPGVTGFIGSSGKGTKPFPVTTFEILGVLGLELGSKVKIVEGEHAGQSGTLEVDFKSGDIVVIVNKKTKLPVQFYEIEVIGAPEINPEESNDQISVTESEELNLANEEKVEIEPHFNVGSTIKINSGSMKDMLGTVTVIHKSKGTAIVTVDFFGRQTEVELGFHDISTDF